MLIWHLGSFRYSSSWLWGQPRNHQNEFHVSSQGCERFEKVPKSSSFLGVVGGAMCKSNLLLIKLSPCLPFFFHCFRELDRRNKTLGRNPSCPYMSLPVRIMALYAQSACVLCAGSYTTCVRVCSRAWQCMQSRGVISRARACVECRGNVVCSHVHGFHCATEERWQ